MDICLRVCRSQIILSEAKNTLLCIGQARPSNTGPGSWPEHACRETDQRVAGWSGTVGTAFSGSMHFLPGTDGLVNGSEPAYGSTRTERLSILLSQVRIVFAGSYGALQTSSSIVGDRSPTVAEV